MDWINLAPYWEFIREKAREREAQKRPWGLDSYFRKDAESHFPGLLGEKAYGLTIGVEPDYTLRLHGDDGTDFPGGIDVKTATYWKDPYLKVDPDEIKKATLFYVLVGLDMDNKRAFIVGKVSVDKVRKAPLKEWNKGNGKMYSLPPGLMEPINE